MEPDLAGTPSCDPCDSTKIKDHIKTYLGNVQIWKDENKRDPTIAATNDPLITAEIKALSAARIKGCLHNLWQLKSKLGTATPGDPPTGTAVYGATLVAWGERTTELLEEYTTPTGTPTAAELETKKQEAAAVISFAHMLLSNLYTLIRQTKEAYAALATAVKVVAGGGDPKCRKMEAPIGSGVVTVQRGPESDYIKLLANKDPTMYPADTAKPCGKLPNVIPSCADAKPTGDRAVQLLAARMGQYSDGTADVTWKPEDAWWEGILNYVADIFSKSCEPMVKPVFAQEINSVIKGYLLNTVKGTLKRTSVTHLAEDSCAPKPAEPAEYDPADATKLTKTAVPAIECEEVTDECDPNLYTKFPTSIKPAGPLPPEGCPLVPLPPRRAYWDQLENALRHCKDSERVLKFKRKYKNKDKDQPFDAFIYTLMGKPYKELVIKDNIEQADLEYAFNYVIDSFWRMFATSLALCMPYIEKELPDVGRQYYAMFTEDFLYPLAKVWRNNRDNPVFELIYGAYYNKKTDYWAKMCMEAAFIRTGDVRWRPPRKLLVNGRSEINYFVQGPVFDLGVKRIYGDHWEVGRFG